MEKVKLARSVRPVPRLKGDSHQMWRFCCWNCGRASEFACGETWNFLNWIGPVDISGKRQAAGYGKNTGERSVVEECIPCGTKNRIIFPPER